MLINERDFKRKGEPYYDEDLVNKKYVKKEIKNVEETVNSDINNINIKINNIVSSGSNANGNWIKFDNGTMICYKTVTASVAMTTAWGSLYEGKMGLGSWAQTFISDPHVQVTNACPTGAFIECYTTVPTTTSAGEIYLARVSSATYDVTIFVFAIGKWK